MTPDEWAATIPISIDGPHSGCHPMCPTHRAISDAIRAAVEEAEAATMKVAEAIRLAALDTFNREMLRERSEAEARARELERKAILRLAEAAAEAGHYAGKVVEVICARGRA